MPAAQLNDDDQYQVRVVKVGVKYPVETGRELRQGILLMKGKVVKAIAAAYGEEAVTDVKPAT